MDVFTAIQTRRSIRKYLDKPVEDEKLNRVLEAARLAPSAINRQDWKFVVVKDPATRLKLVDACMGQTFIGTAPVVLVCCGTNPDSVMRCGQHRYTVDLSIATAYMLLEARESGLGTCWIGSFDEGKVKHVLGIPDSVRVVAVTPLGYPADEPEPRSRKELADIVCYEKFD